MTLSSDWNLCSAAAINKEHWAFAVAVMVRQEAPVCPSSQIPPHCESVCFRFHQNNQTAQSNVTECISATIKLARETTAPELVLELDTSVEKYDRQDLYEHSRNLRMHASFRYELLPRHTEPGLWVADAVAWCFARGGSWRRQLGATLVSVRDI